MNLRIFRCSVSFIHLAVCLTTGPKPLPKRAHHIVRSRASSFKWECPLLPLRSSSSFLRLLPRLPVTYILSFIFHSITRCRRQFLRKMWPIQLAFRLLISSRIFLCSFTVSNTTSFLTCSVQLICRVYVHLNRFWLTGTMGWCDLHLLRYKFHSGEGPLAESCEVVHDASFSIKHGWFLSDRSFFLNQMNIFYSVPQKGQQEKSESLQTNQCSLGYRGER
jgi:hypothetical protein